MWTREQAERYNTIRQGVVAAREECERLIAEGQGQDAADYTAAFERAERGLLDMEAIRQLADGRLANLPAAISAADWETEPDLPSGRAPWFEGRATGDGLPSTKLFRELAAGDDYRLAFDAYCRRLALPAAMRHFQDSYRDVLQVGIDAAGGLLVPPDRLEGVFTRMGVVSPLGEAVGQRQTSRDRVQITTVRPAASDFDIYTSNFIGAWVSEIPAATAGEAEPSFGLLEIPVRKARTKTFLTHEELADPDLDVLAFLEEDGGANLALLVEKAIIIGDGVKEPMGILNVPVGTTPAKGATTRGTADQAVLVNVEGPTANVVSSTTTDQDSVKQITQMTYELPTRYQSAAKWLVNRLTEANIRKLIDGNGSYIWNPGFAGRPDELLGYSVMRSDWVPLDGTDGNKVLVFGNFGVGYLKVIRMLVTAQLDPFSKTDIEQVVLYLRIRCGGDVRDPRAFVIGIV